MSKTNSNKTILSKDITPGNKIMKQINSFYISPLLSTTFLRGKLNIVTPTKPNTLAN